MRRFSSIFLSVSLAFAANDPNFWNVKLTSDSSQRYLVNAQMATDSAAQNFNFVLTTSTPFMTVAGAGCATCGTVNSYNEQNSTTAISLPNSASINLIGGASTSGPLIKEDCFLHAQNGSSWNYPNQTILMSNQSSQLYGDQASGLFGLASGRATNNLNVSIVGGVFSRQPARPSVTFGLALQPPNPKGSDNAGSLHWLGADPSAYSGDITWKVTTVSSDSDAATFQIDGWKFKTGGTTVTNSDQELPSVFDMYYPNMFFPSQEAQLIHASIQGSSSQPSDDGQSIVYTVPCNSKFSLSTIIGGQPWQVDQTLLVQTLDNGTCVSNIQGWADASNNQYLFGSAFMSSLYVIVQIGNPNSPQSDQIGFAKRAVPSSIIGPIVGGVVGGVAGIAIISLAIFFWIRRRDRQQLKDILDSEDRGGKVGRFVENKVVEPFPFVAQPAPNVPTISPTALSYATNSQPLTTPGPVDEVPQSPDIHDHLLPPSYDQTYPTGPSDSSQQQQPNLFPGRARKR
ncbi:aspartic peptidase domain-containing protein [Thelephora terrestris]|uniref:Aspartic peptidase domain-containing protein n=1 Tax=Thelephora terrestris TaxID=56493 RepID=A0A9P6HH48_9AGAM|nr:aspartic peptidase domain-containing protein [Thelephora terrestris]